MRELNKIAEDLFNKIRSRFENVSVGDEKAKSVSDPTLGRFFNFDYVSTNGQNHGNITISLIDENSLKVYFTKDIGKELNSIQLDEWYQFLRNLRQFARRNLLTFDTRDINKSNLQVRDLLVTSKADSAYNVNDINVNEGKMYGSTKRSFQLIGPVKLVVNHNNNVDETAHGSRTRNIESIFVETSVGERFLLPVKKITPARALARHISEGGAMHDEIAQHIVSMVTEMSNLSLFVRKMKNRTFEDIETTHIVNASIERYNQLHTDLSNIQGIKGYRAFVENFQNFHAADTANEFDVESLKERFVERFFDNRLDEALPHVYRAYKLKQKTMENQYVAEFDSWANQIQEGTWAKPDNDSAQDELRELMKSPIESGPDGLDAKGAVQNIIGSDDLLDEFYKISHSDQGQSSDVRPLVIAWLETNGYTNLANEFNQIVTSQQTTATITPQANVQPTVESVDTIIKLAGLQTLRRI